MAPPTGSHGCCHKQAQTAQMKWLSIAEMEESEELLMETLGAFTPAVLQLLKAADFHCLVAASLRAFPLLTTVGAVYSERGRCNCHCQPCALLHRGPRI